MITATSKGSKKILSVFLPSPPLRDTSFLLGDMVLVHLFFTTFNERSSYQSLSK